jgi:chromosome partitioning protein
MREANMARSTGPVAVCVINLKGGVGKSTIAALLARQGYRDRNLDVLAIDIDPQANLSQGLMHGDYNRFLTKKQPSIVEIFNGYRPPSAQTSGPSRLDPNSAVQMVAQANGKSLQVIPSRFDFSDNRSTGPSNASPFSRCEFSTQRFHHH